MFEKIYFKNMRKIIVLVAFGIFSQVQSQVTFDAGVKAGYSASTISGLDTDYRNSFYAGAFGSLNFTKVYNMQFEAMFLQQGVSNLRTITTDYGSFPNNIIVHEENVRLNYLSFNLINKFNFKKFSLHAGPGIDVKISEPDRAPYYNYPTSDYTTFMYSNNSDIDLTVNLGLGYKITEQLSVEGRMRLGIVEPIYVNSHNYNNYSANLNRSFLIGLSYTFE